MKNSLKQRFNNSGLIHKLGFELARRKYQFVFVWAFLCFGCSQDPSEQEDLDMKNDVLDMMPDMFTQDMFVRKDMKEDMMLDIARDLDEMNEPDLLPPGRPCEMDSQCIRGAVCDRDKCSVIVGCVDTFDDPPPTLVGKGCLITGFSKSQYIASECDSDEDCEGEMPCIMNACQDGKRCNESLPCSSNMVCYAELCVEPRQ